MKRSATVFFYCVGSDSLIAAVVFLLTYGATVGMMLGLMLALICGIISASLTALFAYLISRKGDARGNIKLKRTAIGSVFGLHLVFSATLFYSLVEESHMHDCGWCLGTRFYLILIFCVVVSGVINAILMLPKTQCVDGPSQGDSATSPSVA